MLPNTSQLLCCLRRYSVEWQIPYLIAYALISVVFIFALGVSFIHSDDKDIERRERNRNKKERK